MKLHARESIMRKARCEWLEGHIELARKIPDVIDTEDDLWNARVFAKLLFPEVEICDDMKDIFDGYKTLLDGIVETHGLTKFETLGLVEDNFGSIAKYGIRHERHGDCNKPGGWV